MNSQELITLSHASYKQGKYEEAYEILINNKGSFAKDSTLYNFLFSLAGKLNKDDEAIFYLKEAVITLEMWFRTALLDGNKDLDSIRDLEEFKTVYALCKEREDELRYSGVKKIDIDIPSSKTSKLFFMLHGNSQYVERLKKSFNRTTVKDHIIALPQSREFLAYSNYSWGDIDFGLEVASEHYNDIVTKFDIAEDDIILSSYSIGSKVILKGLVEKSLPANKVILFSPWMPNCAYNLLLENEENLTQLAKQGLKIYIVCGENDIHSVPVAEKLITLFTKCGVNHKYKSIDGLAHTLPPKLEEVMSEAFNYFNIK